MLKNTPIYPKELSWLSFNERVLQEVEDKEIPIIERVHFMGIFSSNLDEFYRVKVADVRRLITFAKSDKKKQHFSSLLVKINERVFELQQRFVVAYRQVMADLDKEGIHLINEIQLRDRQQAYVEEYFHRQVLPELEPFFIDDRKAMPLLNEASTYFAIDLQLDDSSRRFAALEIPTDKLPRFVSLPPRKGKREKVYIVLDNIIRSCLTDVFRRVIDIKTAQAFTFKISRDAELELGEQITQNILSRVTRSLKKRKQAKLVRLVYDRTMPEFLLELIKKKLKFGRYDSYTPGGRYHNSKDFMEFPVDFFRHCYKKIKPLPTLPEGESIFSRLSRGDQLAYYPYHDFRLITNLLASSAIDPFVKEININLYRVAKNSRVIAALINAARNHKQVTAVVELQARFDELANIHWSNELRDAGVNVIYGVPGFKVHCKLIAILREENGKVRYYSHLGTGNFNENTARLYCDFSLLTSDDKVGKDVAKVFDLLKNFEKQKNSKKIYNYIAVSPQSNRNSILEWIDCEIKAAESGAPAALFFKCNNLVDGEIISKLYEASNAGVRIRVIVRSMCSLLCDRPGLSDNIEVISLVDKYLEHARCYVFYNGGDEKVWLSSADLMTRNLDHRVEVTFPILDSHNKKLVLDIMELQWSDNKKARVIDKDQNNMQIANYNNKSCRAQNAIYEYLKKYSKRCKKTA